MRARSTHGLLALAVAAAVGLSTATVRAEETTTKSRLIAGIPFGVGQFQNGDVALGVTLAAGEALLGAGSIVTSVLVNQMGSTPITSRNGRSLDISALNREIRNTVTANRVLFGACAALAVAGVIEAEVSFGRRRATPRDEARPSVTATAGPLPGGAMLGLRAAF